MNAHELWQHPAFLNLEATEQAAVRARLESAGGATELDDGALALLGGETATLDADDLRAWLAWPPGAVAVALRPCPEPALSERIFRGLLDRAPRLADDGRFGEAERLARGFARRATLAEHERRDRGRVRDEELGVLAHLVTALGETPEAAGAWPVGAVDDVLRAAGVGLLAELLVEATDRRTGLRGFFADVGRWATTGARDLRHAVRALSEGLPGHEGHYDARKGRWVNWSGDYACEPCRYARPRTEDEIRDVVAQAGALRVVGAGHSFNASPLTDGTLLSLDAYDAVLALDVGRRVARVQAGIRARDLNRALWDTGLALPVLGSTDAQAIGGLLATDLHGTGRAHGFLSTQVRALRVVAADGTARDVHPGDALFHAVLGGLGVCGVVTEVELDLVPRFHLAKATAMVDRTRSEADIERLIDENDHLSFYYVGGARDGESVRMHTWNHTPEPLTPDWERARARAEIQDFAISAFAPAVAELLADIDEDSPLSNLLAPDKRLVMPSSDGFGRKLFYLHDEIEFSVPHAVWQPCVDRTRTLLAERDIGSIIEVRFTPGRSQALLAPAGHPGRSAWIELATPQDTDREALYDAFEALMRAFGGHPHLGKKTRATAAELRALHGERFEAFTAVRLAQDPRGKFLNETTTRLFVGE
jgi:FAD/FMN-containing dehydrogenase